MGPLHLLAQGSLTGDTQSAAKAGGIFLGGVAATLAALRVKAVVMGWTYTEREREWGQRLIDCEKQWHERYTDMCGMLGKQLADAVERNRLLNTEREAMQTAMRNERERYLEMALKSQSIAERGVGAVAEAARRMPPGTA